MAGKHMRSQGIGRATRSRLAAPVLLVGSALGLSTDVLAQTPDLFVTADRCIACHQGMVAPSGEDVSIGFHWRPSMMANSARDPYWQAAVRREVLEHAGAAEAIQGECSKCHMPMASYEARASGHEGTVFGHLPIGTGDSDADRLAADGASCTACHQIGPERLGERESFVGGFVVDRDRPPGERLVFGPFEVDAGRMHVMASASEFHPVDASHIQSSELCATCHTLYTHALDESGQVIGELPEQVPYLEWLHSGYRETRSCQSCHMPIVEEEVAVSGVLGQPRSEVSRHVFRGGNFFMLRMLNRYRDELGVAALSQELAATAAATVEHLSSKAASLTVERVEIVSGRLEAELSVTSLAGHKLPTAYPSRRAWLHFTVRDAHDEVVFESGALSPDGRIVGNDNDADAARFEPHYERIGDAEQVQIYEVILTDGNGRVTTGLIAAVRYAKDNRLLPAGFDKLTAEEDVAVHGRALEDADFTASGDRVHYSVDLGGADGPFRVEAELWYQPIGYRWAQNLKLQQAPEIDRFVAYYDAMASASAVILAASAATAR